MEDKVIIKKEKIQGFTLIELLVAVAIITSLTAMIFPKLAQYRTQEKLVDGSTQLQSDLRTTQNNAVSGVRCSSASSLALSWSLIFTDSSSYKISAVCSAGPSPSTSFNLNYDVSVESVQIFNRSTSCTVSTDHLNGVGVKFDNISGQITFLQGPCKLTDPTKMEITIHLNSNTSSKTVLTAEKGGTIYINQ